MARSRVIEGAIRRAGEAVDRGALRVMARAMGRGRSRRPPGDARRRLQSIAAHYNTPANLAADSAFFPSPAPPQVTETPQRPRAGAARAVDLAFASRWRPTVAAYVDEYASYEANLTVRARLLAAGDAPRPTAVFIHGWGGGAFWFEERAFAAAYWLRIGLDVAFVQLPFHGDRAPRQAPRSGALFPSAHIVRTNEAFGQAVHDVRALLAHLRQRGAPVVGVMGMSLGGYVTALLATVEPDLAFAIPIIPAADMARLMWRRSDRSPQRRRAERVGVDRTLLSDAFRVHAPLRREPVVPWERRMIVAGRSDRITPPDQARDLWTHWGQPAIHWFPGGHLAQIGRGDAFRAIRRHLAGLGLARPLR
ncbi:MAG: abhydrolase domain-containing 18 [Deltaproteobacteria bacterium]|nr:MAG: abhydrolase domain-containing 18 [Deltaproteobacteria bacterium]